MPFSSLPALPSVAPSLCQVHYKIHRGRNARGHFRTKAALAAAGDAAASVWLGKWHFSSNHGAYPDVVESLKHFQRGADAEDGEALYIVGAFHANGLAGLPSNRFQVIDSPTSLPHSRQTAFLFGRQAHC